MCQMRVVLLRDANQEKIHDAVTKLEVNSEGVLVHALFEQPRLIPGATIREVDFLDGMTVLASPEGTP